MSHTNATGAQVLEILDTTLTASEIDPFLAAAQGIVTDLLEDDYEDARLTEIERWLAAHFAAIRDKRVSEEAVGTSQFKYEGKTGMNLDFTRYGQQVQILEHQGILARAGERPAVKYHFSTQ